MSLAAPAILTPAAPAAPVPSIDTGDGALLTRFVNGFEEAENITREARDLSCRDRDYVDNKQLTSEELAVLAKRGQPPLIINRIVRKLDYLRGFERRMRSDPKAFPRSPKDEPNANAAEQAIRFIADDNEFDQVRSAVFENICVEGYGGAETIGEHAEDGSIEVRTRYVPWDRIWYDPHSALADFSDARFMGTVIWMDRDEALETYPDREAYIEASFQSVGDGSYDDRPRTLMWSDNRRTRVRVAQGHRRYKGEWITATFTRGGFLVDPVVSPYLDRRGKPCCPLDLRSGYIDRENNRYGYLRQFISPQDELNKRRSKSLHLLSVSRVIANQGAVADVDEARREAAKPDGYIEVLPNLRFDIDNGTELANGQMELLKHVTAEIDATGPNANMSGKDPREQSGRAIQAQQQGGSVEIEPLIDALRQWDRRVYEAMWMRTRQFWTAQKWIRTTDDDKNIKWVGLNRQVTVADELADMDPDRRAMAMQQLGMQPNDPRLQQVVRVENDISDLDVDITVEDGPDIATLQSETFNQLTQMVQAGVPIPPNAIIKASALRNKDEILEEMAKSQAGEAASKQQQMQAQMAMLQAKVADLQAQAQDRAAQTAERQARTVAAVHTVAMEHAVATAPPPPPQPFQQQLPPV